MTILKFTKPTLYLLNFGVLAASLWIPRYCSPAAWADDPFVANIRSTEPLTPQQQQASFQLPEGFAIQLVAAEPDILKPLNMAFDARGQLWVTNTIEYPFPAPPEREGRDSIKVLSDFGSDGRARKITTFAQGLNIPMGVYPYRDGAVAFSIPHIWRFHDDDRDGRCDRKEKMFGPLGHRDTHGLNNAFRRGYDGWLYACHGFNNDSEIKGRDGAAVKMNSGNTYRFRLDGSGVEQFTWGQVNPFGMTIDPLGNWFTADCHSKPITQLLRGGYFPSFGKPHDGLGFVAPMMMHTHGSTAISGVAYYAGNQFPADYRGNLFSGNVMTSRINRNTLEYDGSTIYANEAEDFVTTTDPWFRPVDVRMGPDGALYIADFYNRIIGHYEVRLDHPDRDRRRGRIWRVVYTGKEDRPPSPPSASSLNLHDSNTPQLFAELNHPNLVRRRLALCELTDRIASENPRLRFEVLEEAKRSLQDSPDPSRRVGGLWVLHRLGAANSELLASAAKDTNRLVRIHAMKAIAESSRDSISDELLRSAKVALQDGDAFVQRAAADALGRHLHLGNVEPLVRFLQSSRNDSLLRHTARMALCNHLRDESIFAASRRRVWSDTQRRVLAQVLVAVNSSAAASFLFDHLQQVAEPSHVTVRYLRHIAAYLPSEKTASLAEFIQRRHDDDIDYQVELFQAISAGFRRRGAKAGPAVVNWARKLAVRLFDSIDQPSSQWVNSPVAGAVRTDNPWALEVRRSADGDETSTFLSSLPFGERLTGSLQSHPFSWPEKITFYMAGHNGPPRKPQADDTETPSRRLRNMVRLRDAASGAVLMEAAPPDNDIAQKVEWDLREVQKSRRNKPIPSKPRSVFLEIVDGDQRAAYAWMAVGRIDPLSVSWPKVSPRQVSLRRQWALEIIGEMRFESFGPKLLEILEPSRVEGAVARSAAFALAELYEDSRFSAAAMIVGEPTTDRPLREKLQLSLRQAAKSRDGSPLHEPIRLFMSASARPRQTALAQTLAADKPGGQLLLELVDRGAASARLLQEGAVLEKLELSGIVDLKPRIAQLTAGLSAPHESLAGLLVERRIAFNTAKTSLDNGSQVYAKQCANCHQLAGNGPLIGPQLDGVGKRGADRLMEDLLDPNRNVDAAFRTTLLQTAGGKVLSGLLRREEGETLVLADSQGKEFSVLKSEIEQQSKSPLSLMPQNVAQSMSEQDFYDLIAFLLRPAK